MSRTVCPFCRQHHRTPTPTPVEQRDRALRHVTVALAAWGVVAGLLLVAVFWVES